MKTQERPDLELRVYLKWVDFRHRNTAPALKSMYFCHLGRYCNP